MTVYTYSEARQKFSTVLDRAKVEGYIQVVRKDGQLFSISPIKNTPKSPLDVDSIKSTLSSKEIVSVLREFRER